MISFQYILEYYVYAYLKAALAHHRYYTIIYTVAS